MHFETEQHQTLYLRLCTYETKCDEFRAMLHLVRTCDRDGLKKRLLELALEKAAECGMLHGIEGTIDREH